jgi:hypothetical protein
MLGQIADHSRIVSPTPTDGYVKQRREAAEKLVADDALSIEILEALVEFAVFGVPSKRGERQVGAANALIMTIQEFQPSFAADVDANQLDLRLVAAVVVGERLRSDPTGAINVYLASLIISALLLQPLPQETYVARLVQELVKVAKAALDESSEKLRERRPWPKKKDIEITGGDHNLVAKSAKTAFESLLDAVASNAKADREELDVLWWVFGGRSARTEVRFDSMPDGERAFLAAIELSERMLMPPIPTAQHLLGSLIANETQLTISKLVEQLQKGTLAALVQDKRGVESVLDAHAALLPLSWLATRLLESDLSPGWQHEFEKKTKLRADAPATLGDWGRQVFAECVAHRLGIPLLNSGQSST